MSGNGVTKGFQVRRFQEAVKTGCRVEVSGAAAKCIWNGVSALSQPPLELLAVLAGESVSGECVR